MSILGHPSPARLVLLSITFVIPLGLCTLLLLRLIYNFLFKSDKSYFRLRAISIIGTLSFIITLFFYYYAEQSTYDVFWGAVPYAMVSLFWGQGNAATYLLYMFRMESIFGDTQYKVSKVVRIILYSMIIFVYLCQLYIVVFFICALQEHIDTELALKHIYITNFIEIIFQIILSISLIILFYKKLLKIVQTCVSSNRKLSIQFTYLATKITVLSGFGGCTTVLWLLLAGIMDIDWVWFPNSHINVKYTLHFLTGIGLMLDCTFNSIVIFLTFVLNEPVYQRLCRPCHYCCDKCTKMDANTNPEKLRSVTPTTTSSTNNEHVDDGNANEVSPIAGKSKNEHDDECDISVTFEANATTEDGIKQFAQESTRL